MLVYANRSSSLTSKIQISKIIPLLSNITFLVILIVKSSLALSLGLVGALSVIRFRTPVKEPEDLAFLFFAIALGIGFGALQIYVTSIIFVILIAIIWFLPTYTDKNIKSDFNIIIQCSSKEDQNFFDKILEFLNKHCKEVNFVKIEKEEENVFLYYKVLFDKSNDINNLINFINKEFKNIKYSFYENKSLD
tara:strand:- start:1607 stop:2182 length:576 start_codon:yes stop_codon:yes gene_type:complete